MKLQSGDKFWHKSGNVYTLFNLFSFKLGKEELEFDISCWILVTKDNVPNGKHRQWCAVDEGNTALGAFGGHGKDFTKVE